MSRFSGRQGKGAMRAHKEKLRTEAKQRNTNSDPGTKLLTEIFRKPEDELESVEQLWIDNGSLLRE